MLKLNGLFSYAFEKIKFYHKNRFLTILNNFKSSLFSFFVQFQINEI